MSGNIVQRSASSESVTSTKTYYSGYYPNNWTVTGGINTNDATAYAKNLESGYTAYCRGAKITGTAVIPHELQFVTNLGSINSSMYPGALTHVGSYFVQAGLRKVSSSQSESYTSRARSINNSTLTTGSISDLAETQGINWIGACNDNYAIIANYSGNSYEAKKHTAYNSSLSRTILTNTTMGLYGANTSSYAYFAMNQSIVFFRYNASLSYSTINFGSDYSYTIQNCTGFLNNYLIAGLSKYNNGSYIYTIYRYSGSGSVSSIGSSYMGHPCSNSKYLVFNSGNGGMSAYNSSFTLSTGLSPLSSTNTYNRVGSDDFCIFVAGNGQYIDGYDTSLVKSITISNESHLQQYQNSEAQADHSNGYIIFQPYTYNVNYSTVSNTTLAFKTT